MIDNTCNNNTPINNNKIANNAILIFGATGQQGGTVACALRFNGWPVKALVRNPESDKAKALSSLGVELLRGDLKDTASIRSAMAGSYGVFSVQPSSGQGVVYGVSDKEEVRDCIYTPQNLSLSGPPPAASCHRTNVSIIEELAQSELKYQAFCLTAEIEISG